MDTKITKRLRKAFNIKDGDENIQAKENIECRVDKNLPKQKPDKAKPKT